VASIPRVRTWLGDEAIQTVWHPWFGRRLSQPELDRLAKLFPEAEFNEIPAEPCHPGCFPRGTLVETPQGLRPIESLRPGDLIIAARRGIVEDPVGSPRSRIRENPASGFDEAEFSRIPLREYDGPTRQTFATSIRSVFVAHNWLWQIETDQGTLLTTETQPLCLAGDRTLPSGKLKLGDSLLCRQGDEIHVALVRRIQRTQRTEQVFNLILNDGEVFIAGGFLARAKPPAEIAASGTGHGQIAPPDDR
jgi:hypothetical protein